MKKSMKLTKLVTELNNFFELTKLKKDPAMSKFFPMVYKKHVNELESYEKLFLQSFNGLLIKGSDNVRTVFTSTFPHDQILEDFINKSVEGDLLFLHHPIPLECGNPKGKLGRGFLRNNFNLIKKIKDKKLSVYACHAPLDYNPHISTNRAIAESLNGKIEETFLPYGNGDAGLIVSIEEQSTSQLISKLKKIFDIPYVDFAGKMLSKINKIGIVAGGGDEAIYSQLCIKKGAQGFITGEIFSNQTSKWAKENNATLKKYVKSVPISLIGVSNSASEYLVMESSLPNFLRKKFKLNVVSIPQVDWWI